MAFIASGMADKELHLTQYFVLMVQIFIGYLKSGYGLQGISKLGKKSSQFRSPTPNRMDWNPGGILGKQSADFSSAFFPGLINCLVILIFLNGFPLNLVEMLMLPRG